MFSWKRKNAVSTDMSEISPKNLKFFPLNIREWKKILFKKIRLRIFLWTQRKLFWPPYWNLYTKSRLFFVHCPQVIKNFPPNIFFQQSVLFGQVEQSFDEAFGIFSTKFRKKFAHWPTMIRNHMFSSGNIFPHSVPVDMQNVLLKTPSTFSTSRQKIVTQKPKKRRKILILKENRSL